MAYNTYEVFKRNLFSKTKKERTTTDNIKRLEKQLKTNKNTFSFGGKKFKSRESAQQYLDKIKVSRDAKAREKFEEIQAKHEIQRLDRQVRKGKKLSSFETRLKKKFPKGLLGKNKFYNQDVKISYSQLLTQLRINNYSDIGGDIIALGWASGNEDIRFLGGQIWELTKTGELSQDDFIKIQEKINEKSSRERLKPEFLQDLEKTINTILNKQYAQDWT